MNDWLELAIIAFIILGIAWVVFRGGQANPEGTGHLGQQIAGIDGRLGTFGARLDDLEKDFERLDKEAASKADIKRLEKAVADLQHEVAEQGRSAAARESTLDHVAKQVDRLYEVIVTKGMG
ncbi:MAG: hypothetical protein U9R07_11925 [Pseudomonadota bacterium]|nr:hypothetical protein [Pseudomonadota bacterium]